MASNYLENKVYDASFRNTSYAGGVLYLSLHTADPGETGASELSGAGYARQAITFGAPVNGVGTNTGTVTVPVPNAGGPHVVSHVGLWDASSGGNFSDGAALGAPINVPDGGSAEWTAGQLTETVT